MNLEALIFDVDGTLADTERDGHRIAFNAAFAEAGLDWHWDEAVYGELLRIAGGLERMLHYARVARPLPDPEEQLRSRLRAVHAAKTRHYTGYVAEGRIGLRPGIARLIEEARHAGLRLGIATTTTRENVIALLKATLGAASIDWFAAIGTAAEVETKKPDPAVYRWVLERLRVAPGRALAVEDSRNGLLAATRAGLGCIVTPTPYSADEDFSEALARLEDLEHHPARPSRPVTLADLDAWLARGGWQAADEAHDLADAWLRSRFRRRFRLPPVLDRKRAYRRFRDPVLGPDGRSHGPRLCREMTT